MNALISEFFDEAITHMMPGLLVTFLFAHRFILRIFHAFNNSDFALCLFLLLAAWLIGLTLDVTTVTFTYVAVRVFKWLGWCTPEKKFSNCFRDHPPTVKRHIELGNRLAKNFVQDSSVRRQFLWRMHRQSFMVSAQQIMYRNLFCVFAATLVPCFLLPAACQPISPIHWHYWYGIVATIIFFAAWQWTRSPLALEKLPIPRPTTYQVTTKTGILVVKADEQTFAHEDQVLYFLENGNVVAAFGTTEVVGFIRTENVGVH